MRVTEVSEVAPHFQPRPPPTDDAGRLHRGGNPGRYAAAPLDLVVRRPDLFGKPDRGMPSQSSLSANRRGKWNPANQAATCVETASIRRMMCGSRNKLRGRRSWPTSIMARWTIGSATTARKSVASNC